ncbi:MAG: hypothetical protein ACKOZM_05990 [Flavobacteriales bacterium]
MRNPEWKESLEVGVIGLKTGDSKTYYKPLEHLVNTGTYYGACRMPGLLPVYYPLRLCLSAEVAQQVITLLQFILESLSCVVLGILGARIYNSRRSFEIIAVLSCITTFVTIRDLYLLSDSFCVAALIFSVYYLSNYLLTNRGAQLLYAGIFIAWAIFLRQICLLALGIMLFILCVHWWKSRRVSIAGIFLFLIPLVLGLTAWTIRNRIAYERTIVLVPPLEECMYDYTPEAAAIRELIITLGEDFQPWAAGGGANWFFQQPIHEAVASPFIEKQFTSIMGEQQLNELRTDFRKWSNDSLNSALRDSLGRSVLQRAQDYSESFKSEHALQYHIGNRILFARNFFFPTRFDDLPFPTQASMNILHKAIKGWSLISLWMVNGLAILLLLYSVFRKRWSEVIWSLMPFGMLVFLVYSGFIEQRYLATSFPFFLMIIGGNLSRLKIFHHTSTLSGADN